MKSTFTVKDILRMEVAPALGCTEPAAVALCAAAAASLLPSRDISLIEVWLDPNLYKNAMGVAIPGTMGKYGIDLSAALGAFGGDPADKLEIFRQLDESILKKAGEFVAANRVIANLLDNQQGIYIKVRLTSGEDRAEAVIENLHDNITSLTLNNRQIDDHPLLTHLIDAHDSVTGLGEALKSLSVAELIGLLDSLDEEDLQFMEKGVEYNTALAKCGMAEGPGLGIGRTLSRLVQEGLLKRDMVLEASMLTAAASDARMAGVNLPAMSSSGSGNHGLKAVLPIWAVKDYLVIDDRIKVFKAIALSHIITAYIKAHTGRLSAVCGCSVGAGAGAAAGITYLMSGTQQHIAGAIKNLIEDLAGVICYGAKASCSLKLATAARTAVQAALLSLHGITVQATDGIVGNTPEQTMKNIGDLSTQGMIETDRTILKIMLNKKFQIIQR